MVKINLTAKQKKDIEDSHLAFWKDDREVANQLQTLKEKYEKIALKNTIKLYQNRADFLEYLHTNIDDVLIGKPKFLREVIKKSQAKKLRIRRPFRDKLSRFGNELLVIFNYDNDFVKGPKSQTLQSSSLWTSYHLVDALDTKVCPYCNRIFTNTFYSKDEGRTRPHLDHYYAKSLYPFLAVSLYNLIPSCYTCNSSFKGDKDFFNELHFHPYESEMGKNIKFTLEPVKKKFHSNGRERNGYDLEFVKGKLENYDLVISDKLETKSKLKEALKNSDNTFHLTDLYASHKPELHELIQLSKIYKPEYTDWLSKRYVGKIFKDENELKQMIIRSYIHEKDFGKRPLSKLTHDISTELKII